MFKKESKDNNIKLKEDMHGNNIDDSGLEEDLQDTMIAQGVKVEGDFNSKGNVVIEGIVVGSVKTSNNLHVGEKAKITASVHARDAFIAGEIQGNVKVKEKLELSPTSKIYGDIEAKTLIITGGAIFNGKCIMADPSAPVARSKKIKKEDDAEG